MAVDKTIHVLVVDDYKAASQSLAIMLKHLGFTNVSTVDGGHAALDKIKTTPYGLILIDWDMEPMPGLELIKKIRANGSKVPVIMITANNSSENEAAAKAAGVNGFLGKHYPFFNIDVLRDKITAVLSA